MKLAVFLLAWLLWAPDPYARKRTVLVSEQLESRGIRNPDVLRVMRTVPRHEFVPSDLMGQAYDDRPLGIGFGATISQPFIVGAMTELAEPAPHHRVLEIGTGSGYQAAVLSMLVREVYSIEIVPELAKRAAAALQRMGYNNVTVRQGDGYKGWPEKAPFDRIVVTAAPPQVPQALLDQLKPGGLLVAPIGGSQAQVLVVYSKQADGKLHRRAIFDVMFVPMVPERR